MQKIFNRIHLKEKRISLRKDMTPAEAILWNIIKFKQLGVKFRRQHGIGNYIADFYSSEIRLVIEVDGGIHNDIVNQSNDEQRELYMEEFRIATIRFSNDEIFEDEERVKEELIRMINKLKGNNL